MILLFVLISNSKSYFHIERPNKRNHDELILSSINRTLCRYSENIILFENGVATRYIKRRGWVDKTTEDDDLSINEYIQKYKLRCGYWSNNELKFKGSECTDPYAVFLDVQQIFVEDV